MERLLRVGAHVSERIDAIKSLEFLKNENVTEPRHRRRRARSHKPFRMQQKLKNAGKPGVENRVEKRGSKKRLREARNERWTPSHLWSSKRLYMDSEFIDGQVVASEPTDKAKRLVLDRAQYGCTVFDMSFFRSFLMKFDNDAVDNTRVVETLKNIAAQEACSPKSLENGFAGEIPLLRLPPSSPDAGKPVAPSNFMWNIEERALFLWSDPRGIDDMNRCFEAVSSGGNTVEDVSNHFSLFRLRGANSLESLAKALGNCIVRSETPPEHLAFWDKVVTSGFVQSPASLPLWTAVCLTLSCDMLSTDGCLSVVPNSSSVGFAALVNGLLSTQNKVGVLLSKSIANEDSSTITVAIIHTEDICWDVVIVHQNPEWARRIWMRLIFAGAVGCGWKNERLARILSHKQVFPDDFAGSRAYDVFWENIKKKFDQEQDRRPLAKRQQSPWSIMPQFDGEPTSMMFLGESDSSLNACLISVQVRLLHKQPAGVRGWLEEAAKLFLMNEKDIDAWKKTKSVRRFSTGAATRSCIGFVTSAIGRVRLVSPNSDHSSGVGNGLVYASTLSDSMKAPKEKIWVYVVNRRSTMDQSNKVVPAVGLITVYTRPSI